MMGVDGLGIPTDEIVDMFIDSDHCPGMDGKLKLFLIQVHSFLSSRYRNDPNISVASEL